MESFHKLGTETAIADLEGDVKNIAKAAHGCDANVFTAVSGDHTGAEKTILVDLDGAVKTMEACVSRPELSLFGFGDQKKYVIGGILYLAGALSMVTLFKTGSVAPSER
jgi:hypothetical protein